ncbi:unnamed protein product, partial [Trichogramma brassicae]
MAHPDQEDSLLKLKCLRAQVDWAIEEHREALLGQLMILFDEWSEPLPNLLEIFQPYEIDWLISEVITKKMKTTVHKNRVKGFIEFVASSGYKESLVDQHINASELRSTPIHQAQRHELYYPADVTRELFKIYDRYDLNYTDEDGLTHFHVACRYGLVDAVRNFLVLGHDPNCQAPPALDRHPFRASLLHLALVHGHKRVVELLLRGGAEPTSTDAHGSTSLHVACTQKDDDDDENEMTEFLLTKCNEIQLWLLIDARDASGRTPLHLAIDGGSMHSVRSLLARGANPNSVDSNGTTPAHAICRRGDEEMARLLFGICRGTVRLDVRDKEGKTPLNYAIDGKNVNLTHLLLANGADARLGMEHLPAKIRRSMMQEVVSMQYAAAHRLLFRVKKEPNDTWPDAGDGYNFVSVNSYTAKNFETFTLDNSSVSSIYFDVLYARAQRCYILLLLLLPALYTAGIAASIALRAYRVGYAVHQLSQRPKLHLYTSCKFDLIIPTVLRTHVILMKNEFDNNNLKNHTNGVHDRSKSFEYFRCVMRSCVSVLCTQRECAVLEQSERSALRYGPRRDARAYIYTHKLLLNKLEEATSGTADRVLVPKRVSTTRWASRAEAVRSIFQGYTEYQAAGSARGQVSFGCELEC